MSDRVLDLHGWGRLGEGEETGASIAPHVQRIEGRSFVLGLDEQDSPQGNELLEACTEAGRC